jgi:hypothetical protein
MGLNADCRKYENTRDHVNNLVDVRHIIKYIGNYMGHVGLQCTKIKLYQTNPTKGSLNPCWHHQVNLKRAYRGRDKEFEKSKSKSIPY